jgi:hypothetical protein
MPLGDFAPQNQAATLPPIPYDDAKPRDPGTLDTVFSVGKKLAKMEKENKVAGDVEAERPSYAHVGTRPSWNSD